MTTATPTFFESNVVIEMTNIQGLAQHLVYTVRVDTFLNMSYIVDRQRAFQIQCDNAQPIISSGLCGATTAFCSSTMTALNQSNHLK